MPAVLEHFYHRRHSRQHTAMISPVVDISPSHIQVQVTSKAGWVTLVTNTNTRQLSHAREVSMRRLALTRNFNPKAPIVSRRVTSKVRLVCLSCHQHWSAVTCQRSEQANPHMECLVTSKNCQIVTSKNCQKQMQPHFSCLLSYVRRHLCDTGAAATAVALVAAEGKQWAALGTRCSPNSSVLLWFLFWYRISMKSGVTQLWEEKIYFDQLYIKCANNGRPWAQAHQTHLFWFGLASD